MLISVQPYDRTTDLFLFCFYIIKEGMLNGLCEKSAEKVVALWLEVDVVRLHEAGVPPVFVCFFFTTNLEAVPKSEVVVCGVLADDIC